MAPAVTVVVPTYRRPALLRRTLAAVLAQTSVELEVVVCDDGSPTPVGAIDDPRVRVIRHAAPRGVVVARNAGIEAASGTWVAFCDDDDLWAPDKLSAQLAALRATGRRWAFAGTVDMDEDEVVVGGAPPARADDVPELLRRYNAIPGGGSGVVVERDLVTAMGGFAEEFQGTHLEDWELWLRLAGQGPPAGAAQPLVGYRLHATNASLQTSALLAGAEQLVQRHSIPLDWGAFHRFLAWTARRGRDAELHRHHLLLAARHGAASMVLRDIAGTAIGAARAASGQSAFARQTPWQRQGQRWISRLAS